MRWGLGWGKKNTTFYRLTYPDNKNSIEFIWLGISYNFNGYRKAGAAKPDSDDRSKIKTGL